MLSETKNETVLGLDQEDIDNELISIKYGDVTYKQLPRKWLYLSRLWKIALENDKDSKEIYVSPDIIHIETLKKIVQWLEMEKGEYRKYGLSDFDFIEDPKTRHEELEKEENKYGFITTKPDLDEQDEKVEHKTELEKYRDLIIEYVPNPEWVNFLMSLKFRYEDEDQVDNFHLVFLASNYFEIPTLTHLCARLLTIKICGVPEWDIPELIQRRVTPEVMEELEKARLDSEQEEKNNQ